MYVDVEKKLKDDESATDPLITQVGGRCHQQKDQCISVVTLFFWGHLSLLKLNGATQSGCVQVSDKDRYVGKLIKTVNTNNFGFVVKVVKNGTKKL